MKNIKNAFYIYYYNSAILFMTQCNTPFKNAVDQNEYAPDRDSLKSENFFVVYYTYIKGRAKEGNIYFALSSSCSRQTDNKHLVSARFILNLLKKLNSSTKQHF
jgi:hypothetical protein